MSLVGEGTKDLIPTFPASAYLHVQFHIDSPELTKAQRSDMTHRYEDRVETHEFTQSRNQKLHAIGRNVSSYCNAEFTNTFAIHKKPSELCLYLVMHV